MARAVAERVIFAGFGSVALMALCAGVLTSAFMPAVHAQTRLVNSDGEVVIIERRSPPRALRSRWIQPDEAGRSLAPARQDDSEQAIDTSSAETAESQPLAPLFDVLGRNASATTVQIPMAPERFEDKPADLPSPPRISSRIEVLGRNEQGELPQLLAELLRDSGEQLVDFKQIQTRVANDQIRYFHPSDRDRAEYIASLLDDLFETLLVRDFSFYQPSPPVGLLELWLR